MRRLHLIEIEDQPWCPAVIRDGVTDYLQFVIRLGKAYHPVAPLLAQALQESRASRIVDLCSGGGGPWPDLRDELAKHGAGDIEVTLTDLEPNTDAFERLSFATNGMVSGEERPVNALHPPDDLTGFRTIFSGFHHFRQDDAKAILQDAMKRGEGIAIYEGTQRSAAAIVATCLAPLIALLLIPAIRPFKVSRLIFTYLIPLIPLILLIDGVVSCLRTYTPDELREMVSALPLMDSQVSSYRWTAGEIRPRRGALPITYLIGYPT